MARIDIGQTPGPRHPALILLLNGAFGIGKTTVGRSLVARLPRAVLFDRFEPHVLHVCLVAPEEVVHERLRGRGADPAKHEWRYRRASECCRAHASGEAFATRVDATDRDPEQLAEELFHLIRLGTRPATASPPEAP